MPQNEMLYRELNRWAAMQSTSSISFDELREKADLLVQLHSLEVSDKDLADTIAEVAENVQVTLAAGSSVVAAGHEPWFQAWREANPVPRWDRYERYLRDKKHWGRDVIQGLDRETSQLVDLVGDPSATGEWMRRGLAIGEVQSGKTANYIGVLNKALDVGYKLIIVLGGHTNDLRRQTQERIDADLLGFDTNFQAHRVMAPVRPSAAMIGVSAFETSIPVPIPHRLTSVLGDFGASNQKTQGVSLGQDPTVAVIKKHAGTINNLAAFLRQQATDGRLDLPMLVIDDESDWASVNTRAEGDPAAVNRSIRALLDTSRRSSYLAYTATPFANVLIDIENATDLFPKDYIRALPSPSNYLGAEKHHSPWARQQYPYRVRTDVDDTLRILPFGHKASARMTELPPSLATAVRAFFIGTAVRRLRDGRVRPAAMMVNVSSLNAVQRSVHEQVDEYVTALAEVIRAELGAGLPTESATLKELHETFLEVYPDLEESVGWEDLEEPLQGVARWIRTELVNGTTTKAAEKRISMMSLEERREHLSHPVVYVGGNVLSRGLTLDGLQVSYFLRRAAAADTLLQMGRWFGYRPGYEDLVRVWMDEEVVDLFDYSREISDELRASVAEMNRLDLTPQDFGLKIRRHPETFRITALNKQRSGEIVESVSIHGTTFSSVSLPTDGGQLRANRAAADRLVEHLVRMDPVPAGDASPVWRSVPKSFVDEFFRSFAASVADPFLGPVSPGGDSQIVEVLGDAVNGDRWDVMHVGGNGASTVRIGTAEHGIDVRPSIRNAMRAVTKQTILLGNRRLAAATDLLQSLDEEARARVERIHRTMIGGLAEQSATPPLGQALVVHRGIERPTLLLYALSVNEEHDPLRTPAELRSMEARVLAEPLTAVMVAFPPALDEDGTIVPVTHGKSFVANSVYMQIVKAEADQGDQDLDEE